MLFCRLGIEPHIQHSEENRSVHDVGTIAKMLDVCKCGKVHYGAKASVRRVPFMRFRVLRGRTHQKWLTDERFKSTKNLKFNSLYIFLHFFESVRIFL